MSRAQLAQQIFQGKLLDFEDVALAVFRYQAQHNELYAHFLDLLGVSTSKVSKIPQIPFLPIQFFKSHTLQTGKWNAAVTFSSSGTTGKTTSRHHIRKLLDYRINSINGFNSFYGNVQDYAVFALLPSYLERSGSSLVYMADQFIKASKYPQSDFFLDNLGELAKELADCERKGIPSLLLGVSFALLDFAEQFPMPLSHTLLMETGGMKGRRKEMTREELHGVLKKAFQLSEIHSEYGMTELLSQGYSKGNGLFYPIDSMQVYIRDVTDPFTQMPKGRVGGINIIDLANLDSCAFIATDDLGRGYEDGSFEVLGRLDNSDIRGCNLLVV